MRKNFKQLTRALVSTLFSSVCFVLHAEAQSLQVNPFTGVNRLWFEWNTIPNTQWAPRVIDSGAKPDKTLQILKFQPVIPFKLSDDLTLVTRTVMRFINKPSADPLLGFNPVTQQPGVIGFDERNKAGLDSINPSFFFVPNTGQNSAIGIGPSFAVSIDNNVGSNQFGVGPAVMAFKQFGRWTTGVRARQIWGVSNRSDNEDLNNLVAQPILRYQFDKNWYLLSSPIIIADFNLDQAWTLPIGGGIGRTFKLSRSTQALISLEAYYNAIKPEFDGGESLLGDWTIRAQVQIAIPDLTSASPGK